MLDRPGDLIPVQSRAATIPWTRRRSQILNYLHRGPVNFSTLVYDTNVGDISSLASYFNEERISVDELNCRFGHYPSGDGGHVEDVQKIGNESVVMPRLLLYPERPAPNKTYREEEPHYNGEFGPIPSQVTVQRTLDWVMSQKLKARVKAQFTENEEKYKDQMGSKDCFRSHSVAGKESARGLSLDALCLESVGMHGATKKWPGSETISTGIGTEPNNLAAALDVVSRLLCDGSLNSGVEKTQSW